MNKKLSLVQIKNEDFYFLYVERISDKGPTNRSYHEHSFYEIMFISSGESEYVIENKRFLLKGGDVLLVKPYKHHFEHNRISPPSTLYCLGFSADKISNGELAEKIFQRAEHLTVGTDSLAASLMSCLKEKLSSNENNAFPFIKSIIEAVIMALDDCSTVKVNDSAVKNKVVKKTVDYINASLREIETLDDIAEPLFFSKPYIRASFKKEMGIGIMEYVRNEKVVLAHERIRRGEKPTEIYLDCGFTTYSSFYRAYCRYFGYSPRKKLQ